MTDLNFAKVFPALCSCGTELGYFQKDIEDYIINGNKIIDIFNSLQLKACCRTSILVAPEYIVTSIDNESLRDEVGLSARQNTSETLNKAVTKRSPDPSHNQYPMLPGTSLEMPANVPQLTNLNLPNLLKITK